MLSSERPRDGTLWNPIASLQPHPGACIIRMGPGALSQRVQLDCHNGMRAQKPYVTWVLEHHSILALELDPLRMECSRQE